MVCQCLDLRKDSKAAKCFANKFVSVLVAVIQLLIWVSALFAFMIQPGPLKEQIQDSPAGAIAVAVILTLVAIGFSTLLIVGLLKDKRTYIQAFLIFIIVLIVLLILSIIVNIFTQPRRFGLSGFLSSILIILLDVLTYVVIRNYFIALTSKQPKQNPILV